MTATSCRWVCNVPQRTLRTSGCQSLHSSGMALHHRLTGVQCFETARWCHRQGSVDDGGVIVKGQLKMVVSSSWVS